MNRQYKSDDIIKGKMADFSLDVPMDLFDQIDQKRSFGHKVWNQIRLNRNIAGFSFLALLLVTTGFLSYNNIDSKASQTAQLSQASLTIGDLAVDGISKVEANQKANMTLEVQGNAANNNIDRAGFEISSKAQSNPSSEIGNNSFKKEVEDLNIDKGESINGTKNQVFVDPKLNFTEKTIVANTVNSSNIKSAVAKNEIINTDVLTGIKVDGEMDAEHSELKEEQIQFSIPKGKKLEEKANQTKEEYDKELIVNKEVSDQMTIAGIKEDPANANKSANKSAQIINKANLAIRTDLVANQSMRSMPSIQSMQSMQSKFTNASPFASNSESSIGLASLVAPDNGCANFGQKGKSYFTVEAVVGPDYSFKSMNARSTEPSDYIGARETSETLQLGFSGGARVSLVTPSGMILKSGLMYAQINEKFEYSTETIVSESEMPIMDTIINGPADTTFLSGVVTVTQVENQVAKSYNQYRMVDVPFLIGYGIEKGKFNLELNTGVLVNVLFRQRGRILDPSLNPVVITDNAQNYFNKTIGLSVYGSVGLVFRTGVDWAFIVEPNVRYQFNPITKSTYPIIQKHLTAGLYLGGRYYF